MINSYKKVACAIDRGKAKGIAAALLLAEANGKFDSDKEQVLGSSVIHGHEVCDSLMLQMLPLMQEQTGLELLPTYSFARIYREGQDLKKHTDRPSCEISTTLTLGYVADEIWPIYADGTEVLLDVGDMLIYKGCEVEHWRKPFKGGVWVQVFLHYVDANGPHKEWAFDKRNVGELYETIYHYIL